MYLRDDVNAMSDDERLEEVAHIVAAGVLRLRSRLHIDSENDEIPGESSQTDLDQCENSCPDDQHGLVNAVENIGKGANACH